MKVLYAEDEVQMSAAVSEILRMQGFEVVAVYDGNDAWEQLERGYFDAVILDVMMPGMDGLEVLSLMRESGNHTPVLMLTAKSSLDDRVGGLAQGADDYLCKPFSSKELIARLSALGRRNLDYKHSTVKMGNVILDEAENEISTDVGSLRISTAETALLSRFMRNPGHAYSPAAVNAVTWHGGETPEKAELYIFYLKNKLHQIRADILFIERDGGYALEKIS